jgi:uncharacterized protein YqgC (DUF456 family)
MSFEQIIGLMLALLVMGLGAVISAVFGLPGTLLVFGTALLHRLYFGDAGPSTWILVLMAGLVVVSVAIDFLGSMIGARKLGATWRGVCGAVVGGLVGLFFSLAGLVLGPFIGAFLFEWIGGRSSKEAARAGLGAMLGLVIGALGKLACSLLMIFLFAASVLLNSFGSDSVPSQSLPAAAVPQACIQAHPLLPGA